MLLFWFLFFLICYDKNIFFSQELAGFFFFGQGFLACPDLFCPEKF
jgi:hypothetical protein